MSARMDLLGKTCFVTGGSSGLGKAIATQLAARGAHVTIFSRRAGPLEVARKEIAGFCVHPEQDIHALSLDMSNASQVKSCFLAQPRTPDILYCSAGGNFAENGFISDIDACALESCMRNNYFAAAFPAKTALEMWLKEDRERHEASPDCKKERRIVFIASAAAFACLPGSDAYSPAKAATRALADTLRMEVLRYNNEHSHYTIHCAFPSDFVSPGFMQEQETKTPLTKRMQGLTEPMDKLLEKFPSAESVASHVIEAVARGEFIICNSLSASVLFPAMIGPSPRRGWGIVDAILAPLVTWLVWPILRTRWEALTKQDGEDLRARKLLRK